jgi:hypothetical protein
MSPTFGAVRRTKRIPLKKHMIHAFVLDQPVWIVQQTDRRHQVELKPVRIAIVVFLIRFDRLCYSFKPVELDHNNLLFSSLLTSITPIN